MLKQILVLLLLATAVLAETAYFRVKSYGDHGDFVLKLTKDDGIKHARALLSGETKDEPHFMGRIKKAKASYNPGYGFHFDPETVMFFNEGMEVCDATFTYVEQHLEDAGGAFLPGFFLCPWSSQLVKEVKVDEFDGYQRSFRTGGRYWSNEKNCH